MELYFWNKAFVAQGIERFVDQAATAAVVVASAAAFDVINVDAWYGLIQTALVGGIVAVLRHLSVNGPGEDH